MSTTQEQVFQPPGSRQIIKAKFTRHDFDVAVRIVMARSGKSRDVAVLALLIAAKRMAEGRK